MSDAPAYRTELERAPLDHAAFGRNRPNANDVIDSKCLERALREKPDSTFSQRALEEGGYYILSYPDIPGCFGVGDTETEAMEDGRRALIAALDALKAVDRPPPEARRGEDA